MEQQEEKTKRQFMSELSALRQQLSDLEEQVINFDLDGDTPEGLESGAVASKRITAELQGILELTSEAAIVVDSYGRIVLANERSASLFGYSQDYLIDHYVEMLIPEHFRGRYVKHRHNYNAAPRIRPMGERLDLVGQRSDGAEIPLRIGLSFIKKNDDVLVFVLMTEATDLEEQDTYGEFLFPTLVPTKIRRPRIRSDNIPRPHLVGRVSHPSVASRRHSDHPEDGSDTTNNPRRRPPI